MNEDVLIAYCLGLLNEDERAAIARDIERHPQAAAFVRQTLDSCTALILDLPPVRVPDYAKDELVGRIRQQLQAAPTQSQPRYPHSDEAPDTPHAEQTSAHPVPTPIPQVAATPDAGVADVETTFAVYDVTPRRQTRHPLVLVGQSIVIAGLVLAGVWWGFLRPLRQELAIGQLLEQTTRQAGAVTYPLLTPAGATLGDSLGVSLGVMVRTGDGELLFVLREPPPDGQVYHVWQRRAGDTQSLGTASARAFFVRRQTTLGSTLLLTLEPADTPSAATNPIASVTL